MCKYKVGLLVNIAINVNTIAKVAIFISFEQRTTSTPSTGLQPITLGLSSLLPVRQDGAIILQGGGFFTKCSVAGLSTQKKWTKWDLRFCENEGSIRFKINEIVGQLDWKSRRKLIQNAKNLLSNTFWWKIRPILSPSISGTKWDRDNPIFSAERGGQSDCVGV